MSRKLAPALLGVSLLGTLVISARPASAAGITADGAVCTLVEAIQSAESDTGVGGCTAGSGDDVITMTADATLTSSQGYYSYADTGLPLVSTTITIEGNGHMIDGDLDDGVNFRILAVDYSGNLTLNDVTISGGYNTGFFPGGGISNIGLLTLNDSVVRGNYASRGGGIGNEYYGTLAINTSEVSYNSADYGGGIYGAATLTGSTVGHNTATLHGGGLFTYGDDLALINTIVSNNEATGGNGGGISHTHSQLTLTDSTVSNNTAGGNGGGIEHRYGDMTVTRSIISGNSAAAGGGIHSRFHFNLVSVINSTISGNSATGNGGGVSAYGDDDFFLTNSTISDNSAGGIGGGFYNSNTITRVDVSLISGNTATGAGDELYDTTPIYAFMADYTVFGHSGLTTAAAVIGYTPLYSNVTATSDGTDPTPLAGILDPLADNGGPTLTHALVTGSPAIDRADDANCAYFSILEGIDQRGEPRNLDGDGTYSPFECDAGAYEAGGPPPGGNNLYLTPRDSGTVAGIGVTRRDILAHDLDSGDWSKHFDGTDVGLSAPIQDFAFLPDGDILLVFTSSQTIPGVGTFAPHDVARFTPGSLGNTTAGTFSWYIDGSDVKLTTGGEKIDALDVLEDGRVLISTVGAASVPKAGGGSFKAQDEDLLALTATSLGANTAGTFALYFNGTAVPGLAGEDVIGAHADEASGDLYLTIMGPFTVGGVSGNDKDVIKLTPSGGGYSVSLFWHGPDNGFNLKIVGLEID